MSSCSSEQHQITRCCIRACQVESMLCLCTVLLRLKASDDHQVKDSGLHMPKASCTCKSLKTQDCQGQEGGLPPMHP